jgi:hypothetical protein
MTSPEAALRFRPIAVAVVRTGRRHAWRILAVSIVVSAVTVAAELVADRLLDRTALATALFGSLSTSTVSLLGAVFLSGFLCRLVSATEHGDTEHGDTEHGDTEHGAHDTRIRDVLRSLPWGSLVLADLLTTLIIVVGLVALVIPGLAAITLLAVVGPVIEIEHRHPAAGLRRSAHLVRPHFWRVVAFATLPLLLSNGIVAILPDPSGTTDVVTTLIVRSIVEGILDSVVGLLLVELCFRLMAADRATARAAARPPSRQPGSRPAGLPDSACLYGDRRGRPRLMVAPGQDRLGAVGRDQGGQGGREPAAGGLACDAFRVRGRVHVEKLWHLADPQARGAQPGQLDPAGVIRRHRHAQDQFRVGPAQAEQPEAAVLGRAEDRVRVPGGQWVRHRFQQPRSHLGGVHADQHDGQGESCVGVVEGGGDPLVQSLAALRRHLEPGRQFCPQRAGHGPLVIQGQGVPGEAGAGPGFQRVDERRLGQHRGFLRGERRGEPGLDPARHRGLGQDDELGRDGAARGGARWAAAAHEASTRRMSRTVRTVPPTVPVTLDRPDRGR